MPNLSINAATNIPSNVPSDDNWQMIAALELDSIIAKIDASDLSFEKVLGSGSFGQVWMGRWRSAQVAIKQIRSDAVNERSKEKNKKELFHSRKINQF